MFCLINNFYNDPFLLDLTNKIFDALKFNCMAVGGIIAVIYKEKKLIIILLNRNTIISYLLVVLPFILWGYGFYTNYFKDELYSILFATSILIITTNFRIINIDNFITSFFGKISYGIYMYHWIILEMLFKY